MKPPPRRLPLSRLNGANPASAAICLRLSAPSLDKCASREWANVGPSLAQRKLPDGFAGGITRGLHRLYKPIIVGCNGWVLGGGLELTMACDIRLASAAIVA